jgi:hypothetical protein
VGVKHVRIHGHGTARVIYLRAQQERAQITASAKTAPVSHTPERARLQTCLRIQARKQERVDPSLPRTSANHAAAERDRRQPVKVVFAGYHRRGESRPWLDHTRPTASPKIVSCLCCNCMISVPLVIMPFPRPPIARRKISPSCLARAILSAYPALSNSRSLPRCHSGYGSSCARGADPSQRSSAPCSVLRDSRGAPRGHVILGSPPLLPASRARYPDVPRLIPRNSFQLDHFYLMPSFPVVIPACCNLTNPNQDGPLAACVTRRSCTVIGPTTTNKASSSRTDTSRTSYAEERTGGPQPLPPIPHG